MATETTVNLAILRFEGKRFACHSLDVECTQELVAYRRIILECAKSLWRRKHVDRERLPPRFEANFRLQFDRLDEGSALVPLRRVLSTEQASLDWANRDEFDEAAQLVDEAISAANDNALLPEAFPANVVSLFCEFGQTLRDDEVLFTRARHSGAEAAYSPKARKRLAQWLATTYEDVVEVVGEVQMASVKGQFSLLIAAGQPVTGKFSLQQEAQVLEALRNHNTHSLRVRGLGEFGTQDRLLKRFVRVDSVGHAVPDLPSSVNSNQDLWAELGAIAAQVPVDAWNAVPNDFSLRADELICRHEAKSK